MLLESAMPRYSKLFNSRKSLAQKIGIQLVTCFCNLETYLNLEFETGKQVSENGVDNHIFDHGEQDVNGEADASAEIDSGKDEPFMTAVTFDGYADEYSSPALRQEVEIPSSSSDRIREHRASPQSLGSVSVSEIKQADQSS